MNCLLLTTTIPDRLPLFDRAISCIDFSADRQNFGFKLIAVDEINGYNYDESTYNRYRDRGWRIVHGSGRGMIDNLLRGLNEMPEGWMLYCEDHVFIESIPGEETIKALSGIAAPSGRFIKYVCYNTHVLEENLMGVDETVVKLPKDTDGSRSRFINSKPNYISYGNDLLLVKNETIKDNYYLNFPAAITDMTTFKALVMYSSEYLKGYAVETGVSQAWFELKFNKFYDVAILVKETLLENLPTTFTKLHQFACMKFRNNCSELLELGKRQSISIERKML